MSERHLGKKIHDLVDGRLSRADAAEAMEHLADCAECAEERAAIVADRQALRTSGEGIDTQAIANLLERDRIAERAKSEPRRHERAAKGHGTPVLRIAVLLLVGVGVISASLYVVGAPEAARLEYGISAPVRGETYAYFDASRVRSSPALEVWSQPHWDDSGLVPIEARLVLTGEGVKVLESTFLAGLEQVLLVQQKGYLPESTTQGYPATKYTQREAFIVSMDRPAHIVFESGHEVIQLLCECPLDILEDVADEFPAQEPISPLERMEAGLRNVMKALADD